MTTTVLPGALKGKESSQKPEGIPRPRGHRFLVFKPLPTDNFSQECVSVSNQKQLCIFRDYVFFLWCAIAVGESWGDSFELTGSFKGEGLKFSEEV